jgi:hypothetical protein
MTTFGDLVYQLGGVPVGNAFGSVGLAGGKVYFVDVANGTAAGGGKTPSDANSSLATAYGYTTSGKNDVVILIGSGSAWAPAASLAWANSYTHLIGAGAPLPGEGARARIEASATADLTSVLQVSGTGNLFSGLKINNMADANVDSGAVIVTGGRNCFVNSMMFGMGHATPGARAGSYSVWINNGEENYFERCTIGTDTVLRAAANSELIIKGPRNSFKDCKFASNSATAGKFMVKIDASIDGRSTIFEDCLFYNYCTNHTATLTDAFTISGGATHDVILKGNNILIGIDGWAANAATVEAAGPAPNAGYGVALKLT